MRIRLITLTAVLALAAPAGARGLIPEAVPDLPVLGEQASRGPGLITHPVDPVTPAPKIVDGNIDDWTGEISRYGGTSIYSRGEYVYQDYLGDNWGADDGQDAERTKYTDQVSDLEPRAYRAEVLSQALGEQFNVNGELGEDVCSETVCAVAEYGDVQDAAVRRETDIEEVRVAADAQNLYVLVRTNGMTKPDATGVLVLLDDGGDPSADCPGHCDLIGGINTSRKWVALSGKDVFSTYAVDDSLVSVATNPAAYVNAIEIEIPLAAIDGGTVGEIGVATGAMNATRDGFARLRTGGARSDLLNVAFRSDEPTRIWMDHDQALALHAGDIDRFVTRIDIAKLRSGYTEAFEPRPGYYERIYVSDSPVNIEQEQNAYFQGQFQHYGIYLPSTYRRSPGTVYPATWWAHYRGGHAHDAAAWVPGLLRQFGEDKGNIMIFPSARGTSSWYVGRGHEDFLEVWDDAMANFPIDPDRVVMTGYSMGGFASWFLPMVYPDRFAAASPQEGPPAIGLFLGVGPNGSDPSSGQNGNDPQATLTYNLIENARHVPYAIYHGTDDELVPISGIVAMQKRFMELGYRNRLYTLDGAEHYTPAVLDIWTEAADYVNRQRRDPDPSRVSYRTWPALEYAASTVNTNGVNLGYRYNKAYWVSDLAVRGVSYPLTAKPAVGVIGSIDVESFGRGTDADLLLPEAGAGLQGTAYEMTGLAWLRNGRTTATNGFRVTLDKLSQARLDLTRMGISPAAPVTIDAKTDGETLLMLTGRWSGTPAITTRCTQSQCAAARALPYDGQTLVLQIAAGTSTITIDP